MNSVQERLSALRRQLTEFPEVWDVVELQILTERQDAFVKGVCTGIVMVGNCFGFAWLMGWLS